MMITKQKIMAMLFGTMAVILACVSGCGNSGQAVSESGLKAFDQRPALTYDPAHYPVTIAQYNSEGKQEQVTYDKPPQRIVAVWQNSIETLIALGVGDRIIAGMGIPDAAYLLPQHRAAYEQIPYKSLQDLSVESVMAMKPDFILGWYSTFQDKVLRGTAFWKAQGAQTYIAPSSIPSDTVKKVHTLETEYQYIENLGKIFDRQDKANHIVSTMKQEIDQAVAYTEKEQVHPRALILEIEERDTLRVYGEETLAGNILQALRGELLLPGQKATTMEEVMQLNPEVLFLVVTEDNYAKSDVFKEKIYANPLLKTVAAVKNKRVYVLPLYSVYSAGIRTLDGIRIISQGLYPDLPVVTSTEFPRDPKIDAQFNGK